MALVVLAWLLALGVNESVPLTASTHVDACTEDGSNRTTQVLLSVQQRPGFGKRPDTATANANSTAPSGHAYAYAVVASLSSDVLAGWKAAVTAAATNTSALPPQTLSVCSVLVTARSLIPRVGTLETIKLFDDDTTIAITEYGCSARATHHAIIACVAMIATFSHPCNALYLQYLRGLELEMMMMHMHTAGTTAGTSCTFDSLCYNQHRAC